MSRAWFGAVVNEAVDSWVGEIRAKVPNLQNDIVSVAVHREVHNVSTLADVERA
jgi:hypothetical protein